MNFTRRPYKRPDRVADELHHILGNLFISEVFIPEAGLLTVTQVKVTDDLKLAKVYFSFLENKKSVDVILDILSEKHNLIRHHLGQNITLKYTPQLRFYYDNTLEQFERIDHLIEKIHKND